MKKTILRVKHNKHLQNEFDVSYKYSGPGRNLIRYIKTEKTIRYLPIEKIFNGKTPIEDIEISEQAFSFIKVDKLIIPEDITLIPEFCFLSSTFRVLKNI